MNWCEVNQLLDRYHYGHAPCYRACARVSDVTRTCDKEGSRHHYSRTVRVLVRTEAIRWLFVSEFLLKIL